ncbi:MAG TPA: 16S rRNA (guanine(527)-N(7))-methyltransferase RsmG [Kofleriaceae bacterium]|jgi:16S rRNA (guanine527-N7)-methyltransferase
MSDKIAGFIDLFLKWNERINLSAASTRAELQEHVDDCLHVVPILGTAKRVLDVGSGGGLPVVIAAISMPDQHFVALEPIHKKHAFLKAAARELSLDNLEPLALRLEQHDQRDYDAAMSRATFDLADWFEAAKPFVRADGVILGFEGQLRADLGDVERFPYELGGKTRAIVVRRST